MRTTPTLPMVSGLTASWLLASVSAIGCGGGNTFAGPSPDGGDAAPFSLSDSSSGDSAVPPSFEAGPEGSITAGSLTLSAVTLDFGLSDCGGTAPAAQTLVLRNDGSQRITFTAAVDNPFFSVPGSASAGVDPGQSVSIAVAAQAVPTTATAGVALEGNLNIVTSDSTYPSVGIPLRITPQGASLRLVPSTVDFGEVSLNQSESLPVSLSNVGNKPAQLHVDGPGGDFALTWDSQGDVSVDPSMAVAGFVARFRPTTTSPQVASVPLRVSGAVCGGSVGAVPMKGAGTTAQATVGPGTLDFSLVSCGSQGAAQVVRLKNWGNAPFNWNASLQKASASPFSVSPASGQVVAGATSLLAVQPAGVLPPASTAYNAFGDTLLITTDAATDAGEHSVVLLETAQGAVLTVNPTALAFGAVAIHQTSTLPFTVTNVGNRFANVALVAGPGGFRSQPGSLIVGAGAMVSAAALFQPPSAGIYTGTLTLSSTDPLCAPISNVSLSGSADAPPPPPPPAMDSGAPPASDAASDAPTPADGGAPPGDAGTVDAGTGDAGTGDAGTVPNDANDAAPPVEAGAAPEAGATG